MTAPADRARPFHVLFVCTGNTCRSPMAEAIARRLLAERGWHHMEVSSAGTSAPGGAPASQGAMRAGHRHGLELERHRARPVTPELLSRADIVLTMTPAHRWAVVQQAPDPARVHVLPRFVADGSGEEAPSGGVPDPFGGSDEVYEATYLLLERLVASALERIHRELEPTNSVPT